MPYRDRRHAGEALAQKLLHLRGEDVLVLGLARGGVPVAAEVARALAAPLDVMVARKIGAPGNPEYGIGAVAPGGVRVVDEAAARALGVSAADLDAVAQDELLEVERRLLVYRGRPVAPRVEGRTVVLVDDGLATGVTARAALRALRADHPRRLVLAVPVGPDDAATALADDADEVIVAEPQADLRAVGLWYDDFRETTDDEVLAALAPQRREVTIAIPGAALHGELVRPSGAQGLVVFAHGSGSGRHSPRNQAVAATLQRAGLATLLVDLLTPEERHVDDETMHMRFDIALLAERVGHAVAWAHAQEPALLVGCFGSSTGAAAALLLAAQRPEDVAAVVSRGGRVDLAGSALPRVFAPTLLIVGGADPDVLALNEHALASLPGQRELRIIEGASHLFEEPGALELVAEVAADWFSDHLVARSPRVERSRA